MGIFDLGTKIDMGWNILFLYFLAIATRGAIALHNIIIIVVVIIIILNCNIIFTNILYYQLIDLTIFMHFGFLYYWLYIIIPARFHNFRHQDKQ